MVLMIAEMGLMRIMTMGKVRLVISHQIAAACLRVVRWFIIQLLHAVMGSMAFCTPKGENGTRGEAEGAIFPSRVNKTYGPQ